VPSPLKHRYSAAVCRCFSFPHWL